MKIQIRPRGLTLTKTQSARLMRDLEHVFAQFGERIERVIVEVSPSEDSEVDGFKCCEIEVRMKPQVFKVEDCDTDVVVAIEHAARRVARSLQRALETGVVLR
ncbi:MAG: HPF/RaiA family ribosome-associated protein [Kofleriaceae bacterium]